MFPTMMQWSLYIRVILTCPGIRYFSLLTWYCGAKYLKAGFERRLLALSTFGPKFLPTPAKHSSIFRPNFVEPFSEIRRGLESNRCQRARVHLEDRLRAEGDADPQPQPPRRDSDALVHVSLI